MVEDVVVVGAGNAHDHVVVAIAVDVARGADRGPEPVGGISAERLEQPGLVAGQDPRAARGRAVVVVEVDADDEIVEIGPGRGALTRHLAGACRSLILVEIDDELVEALLTASGGSFSNPEVNFYQIEPTPLKTAERSI